MYNIRFPSIMNNCINLYHTVCPRVRPRPLPPAANTKCCCRFHSGICPQRSQFRDNIPIALTQINNYPPQPTPPTFHSSMHCNRAYISSLASGHAPPPPSADADVLVSIVTRTTNNIGACSVTFSRPGAGARCHRTEEASCRRFRIGCIVRRRSIIGVEFESRMSTAAAAT